MKTLIVLAGLLCSCGAACCWLAQPPGGPPPGEGRPQDGRPPQDGRRGAPPRFELGRVLPPPLREQLELTEEQSRQLAELEKDVKAKLERILTPEQRKKLSRQGPPQGSTGDNGPGGPPTDAGERGRPKGPAAKPGGEKKDEGAENAGDQAAGGGIQWFGTLERGLAAAKASGRPILLLSAAPHCGGIPGMW